MKILLTNINLHIKGLNKLFLIIGLFFSCSVSSQVNMDEQLGAEFFNRGEYDKAIGYYKKLLQTKPDNEFIYKQFMACVVVLKDYKSGEAELKTLLKKRGDAPEIKIDLGFIYLQEQKEKEAKKTFESVIDKLPQDPERIETVADMFLKKELIDYALATYQKGQKLFNTTLMFSKEVGNIYLSKKQYKDFIDVYTNWMDREPGAIEEVKEGIQEAMRIEEPYQMMKREVLKRLSVKPDDIFYADLMGWMFMQKKDFNGAFIQLKSIDKRLKEGGRRLIELARVTADLKDFETSEKIANYIIEQGKDQVFYITAQKFLLDLRYNKITKNVNYTITDINTLLADYQSFLNTYGYGRNESAEIVLKQAEILALYGNRVKDAIDILEKYNDLNPPKNVSGKAKLALGDYYLLDGEIWEATLRYSQVEKLFKDEPLGHEAKFRNAKLAFYNGEFDWAKAQLDVLKGSTSELIANDALQLSLLIQDYKDGDDTLNLNLRRYAKAELLIYKNQFTEAEQTMDSIKFFTGINTLGDDILMLKAEISFKRKEFQKSLEYYKEVYTNFSDEILADDALYKAALIDEEILNDKEGAKSLYEKIILEHKGSIFGIDASARYRRLRGDVLN